MKQLKNDNAANRTSYVGYIYNIGEKNIKKDVLNSINKEWKELHNKGYIHIHDLDAYGLTYNCLTFDILKRFPYEKFINVSDTCKIIYLFDYIKEIFEKIGNEQSGGMAFANFDNDIATIIKKLRIDYRNHEEEISSCIGSLIIWCNNNHTRMVQTSYYVTLNIGLAKTDCARFIAKSLLLNFKNSDDKIFKPNIVFKVSKGINLTHNDKNYDLFKLALECSAKKMIPTYLICDCKMDKDINPESISVMGCRTRVVSDLYNKNGSIGRGNIANITINLPRLALEIDKDFKNKSIEIKIEKFLSKWDSVANLVKDILLDRYNKTCKRLINDFPANKEYNLWCEDIELGLENLFKHGTLSIGFIGLSEAMEILTYNKFYKDDKTINRSLYVIKHVREFCDNLINKYKLNFSLLATSGEYISGRFIDIDKKYFKPSIDIFSKGFYTNSFHIDVDSSLSFYEKILIEGKFHEYCNGGCITYLELKEAPLDNIEGLEDLIIIALNNNIHYLGFNYPKDICNDCNYSGIYDICPKCNSSNITRIRRVSGYLEILDGFTKGKKAEVKYRKNNEGE